MIATKTNRRNQLDVMASILGELKGSAGLGITDVLYSAGSRYDLVKGYLKTLQAKGFIERRTTQRKRLYIITPRGEDLIKRINSLNELWNS